MYCSAEASSFSTSPVKPASIWLAAAHKQKNIRWVELSASDDNFKGISTHQYHTGNRKKLKQKQMQSKSDL